MCNFPSNNYLIYDEGEGARDEGEKVRGKEGYMRVEGKVVKDEV